MINVELGLFPDDSSSDASLYERLIQTLFAGREDIGRVRIDTLPDRHAGYSALTLLLARPYGVNGGEQNPLLIRVGSRAAIMEEKRRYDTYVEPFTGSGKVSQRWEPAVVDQFAAIAYSYVRSQQNEPPVALSTFLAAEDDQGSNLDRACRAVTTLFRDTLAQSPQENCWYSDGRAFDAQRPIWFYNTVLPPTVTLRDVRKVDQPNAEIALTNCLQLADAPEAALLDGKQIYLTTNNIYPALRVVERRTNRDQCVLRLHLYEQTPDAAYSFDEAPMRGAPELRRPFRPIAARIDAIGSADELGNLPDKLDTAILQGRIEATRYRILDQIRLQFFNDRLVQTTSGGFISQNRVYDNPIRRYHELLYPPRRLITSIVHGDMNLNNILLNRGSTDETTAWLIDFDKTTSGGHAVFDAVKLETEYKAHILPHRLASVEEFIRLENALHQALINPTGGMDLLDQSGHLRDAYQFITTIRRAALQNLRMPIPPEEYYLGLVAYGLAALKYPNLYAEPERRQRWVRSFAKVEPLAIAAYLSASFAATAIREVIDLTVTAESYLPPPRSTTPQIKMPRLIGRDDILKPALLQLRSNEPVVLLHGVVGSGRGVIAQYIGADLERQGYVVWRYPPIEERTVGSFVAVCEYLEQRGEGTTSPTRSATGLSHNQTLAEDLLLTRERLRERLEGAPRPIALLIRLSTDDAELRSFLVALAMTVHRTAMVLITDTPLDDLHVGIKLAVPPFSLTEVQAYVQQKYLPLDESAIQRLYTASHGLPALLDLLVREAQSRQSLTVSLNEAVLAIEPTHSVTRFMENRFHELREQIRHLIEIDAILNCYTPEALAPEASGEADRLRRVLIDAARWSRVTDPDVLLEEYQQFIHHDYRALQPLLYAAALGNLPQLRLRRLCEWIAIFYQNHDGPEASYRAARYHELAGERKHLRAVLLRLAATPDEIFTKHCEQMYRWIGQELKDTRADDCRWLLDLAGDCAAYLGQPQEAAEYYNKIRDELPDDDPSYPWVLARLLRVYEASGDDKHAQTVCEELLNCKRAPAALHAFAVAYKAAANMFMDPDQAAAQLSEASALLGAPDSAWGRDEKELWVRLQDALARVEATRGDAKKAISILKAIYPIAKDIPSLQARIDNDIAYVHYYLCGQPEDIETARRCFKKALDRRDDIKDRVGVMRTAQNLANLQMNLAASVRDWDEAEGNFQMAETAAAMVQAADRYLIVANHMDALIHRGDFVSAKRSFDQIALVEVHDEPTRILLLLNRAKLALWANDKDGCAAYLAECLSPIADMDWSLNKIEWSQIALECTIRLEMQPEATAIEWMGAIARPDDQQSDTAEWFFAQALLALMHNNWQDARAYLAESYRIWSEFAYRYRAAIVQYWQTYCELQGDNRPGARIFAEHAARAFAPFGETPICARLLKLREQIEQE